MATLLDSILAPITDPLEEITRTVGAARAAGIGADVQLVERLRAALRGLDNALALFDTQAPAGTGELAKMQPHLDYLLTQLSEAIPAFEKAPQAIANMEPASVAVELAGAPKVPITFRRLAVSLRHLADLVEATRRGLLRKGLQAGFSIDPDPATGDPS